MGAFTEIYVDPAIAADSGDGLQALDSNTFTNATYDHTGNSEGERHIASTGSFSGYTFTAGDLIFLQNAVGGVADGIYEIASKVDSDAILLVADGGLTADSTADVDSGSPFGDVEYAIVQTTFDITNGTKVNVKAGTDEVLTASVQTSFIDTSVDIAWLGGEAKPIVFEGYTVQAADGGIGGISGGGLVGVMDGLNTDYVSFFNLHLHNTGAKDVIYADNNCAVINCEINNTSASGIRLDGKYVISGNYVHDCGNRGIRTRGGGYVVNNFLHDGASNKFATGIDMENAGTGLVENNIIQVSGSAWGIDINQDQLCIGNSVYAVGAATGKGIAIANSAAVGAILNNLVEGFSGSGGVAFELDHAGSSVIMFAGNAAYDNTTDYATPVDKLLFSDDNESLGASPFTDAANGDFNPVDTGNVKEGANPGDFNDTPT